jgi:hypothetical protein
MRASDARNVTADLHKSPRKAAGRRLVTIGQARQKAAHQRQLTLFRRAANLSPTRIIKESFLVEAARLYPKAAKYLEAWPARRRNFWRIYIPQGHHVAAIASTVLQRCKSYLLTHSKLSLRLCNCLLRQIPSLRVSVGLMECEVNLKDICLEHAFTNVATPGAFLERSNVIYWLAITGEVGHRVILVRDTNGVVVKWDQEPTHKRATNHFWGWHTSPLQREDVSVMGHVFMQDSDWIYPRTLWEPNPPFHMGLDQTFQLLTGPVVCPAPTGLTISFSPAAGTVTISWSGTGFMLQATPALLEPTDEIEWTDVGPTSPVIMPASGPMRYFRLICP